MRTTLSFSILCLTFGAACRAPDDALLSFDAGPSMQAVRADAAAIARTLDRDELAEALDPAHRLANLQLGPGHQAPDPFRAHEEEFRGAAEALIEALEAEDSVLVGRRFELLLDRCDACHAGYRRP